MKYFLTSWFFVANVGFFAAALPPNSPKYLHWLDLIKENIDASKERFELRIYKEDMAKRDNQPNEEQAKEEDAGKNNDDNKMENNSNSTTDNSSNSNEKKKRKTTIATFDFKPEFKHDNNYKTIYVNYVSYVNVDDGYQGQGMAEAMFRYFLDRVIPRYEAMDALTLYVGYAGRRNASAVSLYEKIGFEWVERNDTDMRLPIDNYVREMPAEGRLEIHDRAHKLVARLQYDNPSADTPKQMLLKELWIDEHARKGRNEVLLRYLITNLVSRRFKDVENIVLATSPQHNSALAILYESVGFKWSKLDCSSSKHTKDQEKVAESASDGYVNFIYGKLCEWRSKAAQPSQNHSEKLTLRLAEYIPPVGYEYWIKKIDRDNIKKKKAQTPNDTDGWSALFTARDRSEEVGHITRSWFGSKIGPSTSLILTELWVAEKYRRHGCGVEEALIRDAVEKVRTGGKYPKQVESSVETIKVGQISIDIEAPVVVGVLEKLGFVQQTDDEQGMAVFKRHKEEKLEDTVSRKEIAKSASNGGTAPAEAA